MTGDRQRSLARTASWIAGALVGICVAILLTDYVVASRRAPGDDKLIKDLQQQTKADAAFAPKLAAEQKRVTVVRRARKSRDNAVAWALIAAAAAFLMFAKQVVKQEEPAAPGLDDKYRDSADGPRGHPVRPTSMRAGAERRHECRRGTQECVRQRAAERDTKWPSRR